MFKASARPIAAFTGLFAALLGLLALGVTTTPARASSYIDEEYNGYPYKVFVPSGYVTGTAIPLVVMLHGCSQDAETFAIDTEMNTYAEQHNFIVIYPEQLASSNAGMCWNWFEPAHQSRGSGEPAVIVGMVDEVKATYTVDSERVYVAGMSAGAALSVILGVTYPDVFAAIGESAGLEYKAADNTATALIAQQMGGPDPETQGNIAYEAMGPFKRVVPVIVFHGSMDATVQKVNADQVISQWAQTNDRASDGVDDDNIDDTPEMTQTGAVPAGRTYTHYIYNDSDTGQPVMEKYIVDGMSHRWSGGGPGGSIYVDPQGPEASLIMWEFFASHPMLGEEPTPSPTPSSTPSSTPIPSSTGTPSSIPSSIPSYTRTPIPTSTPTYTRTPIPTSTPTSTRTHVPSPSFTRTPSSTPSSTPVPCDVQFSDVPQGSPFYVYVRCLACRGIIGGFSDGTFRPGSNVTRGQLSKIVANAAGFNEQVSGQTFEDVPVDSTYHTFIERLAARHIIGGYPCGGPGEDCGEGDRPYFRQNAGASRGQIAKIVSDAAGYNEAPGQQRFEDVSPGSPFYEWVQRLASRGHIGGYPCSGPGEPCGEDHRPYFRPGDSATRGQTAKIVANTFFPRCETSTQAKSR